MATQDSWWSCVVCFGLFVTAVNTLGVSFSLGIYFTLFKEEFNASNGATSLISGLNYGLLCGLGPLTGVLVTKLGCRLTLTIAGALSSLGLGSVFFANSLAQVIIFLGVICGVGFGLAFTTLAVAVSQHFAKYRNIALGVVLAGSGVGMILYPYLTTFLSKTYGWRGAILISSAIQLHAFPVALLAKEPEDLNTYEREEKSHTAESRSLLISMRQLTTSKYVLFLISCALMSAAHIIMTTHLAAYVTTLNFTDDFVDLLMSDLGVSATLGKLFLAWITQVNLLKVPTLFILSQAISALCLMALALIHFNYGLLIAVFMFGIFISVVGPTLSEMTFLLTREDLYPVAYGCAMFACGFGGSIGPPIAGLLYDVTEYYPSSFYLGAGILLFSTAISLVNEKCSCKLHESSFETEFKCKDILD